MELNRTTWDEYEHAKWRVHFVLHMLDMPEAKMATRDEIAEELADYTERLKIARGALSEFPREWAALSSPTFR
ncbi:MAG TPA: hypothetical protein VLE43_17800 [Candidatus Saccharimonadia bacterium]|nr:hypothetical protein [Candidatus Saccharimonadia bacterium]